MRKIGLIGGMSWESTAVYYRVINTIIRERLGGLHSAEILLQSVDFTRVVALQKADDWAGAAALLGEVGANLVRAGAETVLICTNTMHIVADQVAARVSVPLINVIDETATSLAAAGRRRPLLLATRYSMEHGFYLARMRRHGIDPIVPGEADRATVHEVIFSELCCGLVLDRSRARLLDMIVRAAAAGADSVILGCTELCLLLDPAALPLRGFDSTAIHAAAAATFSLAGSSPKIRAA